MDEVGLEELGAGAQHSARARHELRHRGLLQHVHVLRPHPPELQDVVLDREVAAGLLDVGLYHQVDDVLVEAGALQPDTLLLDVVAAARLLAHPRLCSHRQGKPLGVDLVHC